MKLPDLSLLSKENRQLLIYLARVDLARRYFWYFCKAVAPDFYTDDKIHLHDLCDKLQRIKSKQIINRKTGRHYRKVKVHMPPRFGKSRTIALFEAWCFGLNNQFQCITISYGNKLSLQFSRSVRDLILAKKKPKSLIVVYSDIFPKTKIKKGNAAAAQWALKGSHFSFLSTSFESTITGFGANGLIVIDDQVKDSQGARDIALLNKQYEWVCDTMLSRLEDESLFILNMTKWSTVDIGGRIDASEDAENWLTIIYEAKDLLTGKMLCPKILNEETYDTLRKLQSPDIFMANYHQKPINIEGRMYKNIKIWSKDEITFDIDAPYIERRMIIDPSDGTGNDYFCAISFAIYKREAYIFDVLYVNEAAKCTPYIIAKRIITNRVKHCKIEANRGRLLIQTIKDRLKEMSHSITKIEDFVSVDNKKVRISSCAWAVQETIYFPKGWSTKYPKFYVEIYDYQETGKNAHDDGAEVLSWISEDLSSIGKGSERAVFPINIPKKEKELFYGYR